VRHLNYSHLYYFWTVAREGSIAKASKVLHLTPQTISGQLKALEESIGEPLFHRVGRGLVLSESGKLVNQYADEIFSLGAELAGRVRDKSTVNPVTLNVGIVDSIPKLIAYRLLSPALEMPNAPRLVCHETGLENLLGELSVHQLDIILSDRPLPRGLGVKAFNHFLGSTRMSFFSHRSMSEKYKKDFPSSIHGEPVLLPLTNSPLRRQLDEWFSENHIAPKVIAEFDDSALLKAFASVGKGLFLAPDAISEEIEQMYESTRIGSVPDLTESYYAISPERKITHPAVSAIFETSALKLDE
jgi:LysR family transcriptional regulator, transcriptional activator of nhaA